MTDDITILNTKCPICGQPATLHYKPFCSKRCADIDLGRWLKGNYVAHTDEVPTEEDLAETLLQDNK